MAEAIVAQHGLIVQIGPFQGMQYVPELLSPERLLQHAVLPKILGCYEAELHSVLRRVFERNYDKIVNIGCIRGLLCDWILAPLPEGAHSRVRP
jgi:hypothetical protein